MMKKAREVLESYVDRYGIDQQPSQFADWVIGDLADAGFVILPKEPTKEMVLAGEAALDDCKDGGWDSGPDGESYNSYEYIISGAQTTIYKAMLTAAVGEEK